MEVVQEQNLTTSHRLQLSLGDYKNIKYYCEVCLEFD